MTGQTSFGGDRKRWLGLVVISLGVSLIIVDSTIVNVAIPSIIDDIGITLSHAEDITAFEAKRPAYKPATL